MKRMKIFLVAALAVSLAACGTLSKDMALTNKGYEYMTMGDYAKAEEYFLKALDINPDNEYATLNLGVVYQNTERAEEAKEMYKKVIALNPEEEPEKVSVETAQGKSVVEIAEENLRMLER